jgi:hypothetical protein
LVLADDTQPRGKRRHGMVRAADTVAGPSPAAFTGITVIVTVLPEGRPWRVTSFLGKRLREEALNPPFPERMVRAQLPELLYEEIVLGCSLR